MSGQDGNRRSRFVGPLGFEPDRFQLDAFDAIDEGRNVIVAAPTGAGKTLVADYAVDKALSDGNRLFYTTPVKALSNQKFHDLLNRFGSREVGLLTGDNSINPDASVVVMTTEVLRNMLYAGNNFDGLAAVVLDEVHYLQDAYRGPVWEEVIIHLPRSIRLVCLSATVSNGDELQAWIEAVRGTTGLVVETHRPVELTTHYLTAERRGSHIDSIRVIQGSRPNPKGFRYDHDPRNRDRRAAERKGGRRPAVKYRTPTRREVICRLDNDGRLPAIYFIFSRAGCDDAARSVVDAGMVFTNGDERQRIQTIIDDHLSGLSADDARVLEVDRFRRGMGAGVAAHHAGMVPPMKEAVEACFVEGLVKVVFATETLALGINMPARSVVIEKLTKFTGEHHEFLTPAQFTQLTGRAGRRGIDTHGDAYLLWSPFVQFEAIATLVSSKRFELRSAFRPTYNMAANLVRRYTSERARQLLNQSFAQFRADAGVVAAERKSETLTERRRRIEGELEAGYGPVSELRAAFRTTQPVDADTGQIALALSRLSPGDIIEARGPELPPQLLVIAVSQRKRGRVLLRAIDGDAQVFDLNSARFDQPPITIGSVRLPEPYLPQSVSFLHEASQLLTNARVLSNKRRRSLRNKPDALFTSLDELPPSARKKLKQLDRVERDLASLQKANRKRVDSLGAQFDRVIDLLVSRNHLDGWELTPSGARLARLYHECDLLIVEALEADCFDDLGPPEVAALASVFIYEERRSNGALEVWYPSAELRRRFRRVQAIHLGLVSDEVDRDLPTTRAPDAGFVAIAYGWASGGDLIDVLGDEDLTPGDFVRTTKQLIDLLRQIAVIAANPATGSAARSAADQIFRGLVAASSMLGDESDDESEPTATDSARDSEPTGGVDSTDDTDDN